jgi:hypothetical protein
MEEFFRSNPTPSCCFYSDDSEVTNDPLGHPITEYPLKWAVFSAQMITQEGDKLYRIGTHRPRQYTGSQGAEYLLLMLTSRSMDFVTRSK